jgi:hypothetical protein
MFILSSRLENSVTVIAFIIETNVLTFCFSIVNGVLAKVDPSATAYCIWRYHHIVRCYQLQ